MTNTATNVHPSTITPARYGDPDHPTTVTVHQISPDDMPPAPETDAELAQARGHQRLELDITAATLTVVVRDWRTPDPDPLTQPSHHPRNDWEAPAVPPRLGWSIVTRYGTPPLTADQLNAIAHAAAPHAATLIDRLYAPHPEPDAPAVAWWSADSHTAAEAIAALCSPGRSEYTPDMRIWHLDMEEAARLRPAGIDPVWADQTDPELWSRYARDNARDTGQNGRGTADTVSRFWANEHWGNKENLLPHMPEPDDRPVRIQLWGVIPWLVAYRATAAAEGTRTESADTYLHARPELWRDLVNRVRPDSEESALDTVVDELKRTARDRDAVTLAGARSYVLGLQEDARRAVADQLEQVGEECAELEERLKASRLRRRSLVTQYMAWAHGSDADIARKAHLSPAAVSKLRAEISTEESESE